MHQDYAESHYASIFEDVSQSNQSQMERSLIQLSSISLNLDMDYKVFYNEGKSVNLPFISLLYSPFFSICLASVKRLFELSNQVENRLTLYATDVLRNLVVQAFLLEKVSLAQVVLQNGFTTMLHELIEKAIKQLQWNAEQKASKNRNKSDSLCQLAIEQAFICLADTFHFIEHSEQLKVLTESQICVKAV